MTDQDCTCETYGRCAVCRPEPEWHTLGDEEFLERMSAVAKRMNPAEMQRAAAAMQRRFHEPLIQLSPDAVRLRKILDDWDDPGVELHDPWIGQFLEPAEDHPPGPIRLTKEGSRLYMETLRVF